jgi:hypothetical protein
MTSTNPKDVDYLKPWAIFFVLSFVAVTIATVVIGLVIGGILKVVGASPAFVATVSSGLGFLVSLPISYFCFRFVVAKFLLPKVGHAESTVEPLKAAA